MKTVVVIFLATLLYAENPQKSENLYSWQIQFSNFDKCQMFYEEYEAELLNGLLDHSKQKYKMRTIIRVKQMQYNYSKKLFNNIFLLLLFRILE